MIFSFQKKSHCTFSFFLALFGALFEFVWFSRGWRGFEGLPLKHRRGWGYKFRKHITRGIDKGTSHPRGWWRSHGGVHMKISMLAIWRGHCCNDQGPWMMIGLKKGKEVKTEIKNRNWILDLKMKLKLVFYILPKLNLKWANIFFSKKPRILILKSFDGN